MAVKVTYRSGCKTCYHGPTDTKGSRIVASHLNTKRRIIRSWDDALGVEENHGKVAAELLGTDKLLACSLTAGGFVFLAK